MTSTIVTSRNTVDPPAEQEPYYAVWQQRIVTAAVDGGPPDISLMANRGDAGQWQRQGVDLLVSGTYQRRAGQAEITLTPSQARRLAVDLLAAAAWCEARDDQHRVTDGHVVAIVEMES